MEPFLDDVLVEPCLVDTLVEPYLDDTLVEPYLGDILVEPCFSVEVIEHRQDAVVVAHNQVKERIPDVVAEEHTEVYSSQVDHRQQVIPVLDIKVNQPVDILKEVAAASLVAFNKIVNNKL